MPSTLSALVSEEFISGSAAEFRKYCKRLHVDLYMKRRRLRTKYSIVHIVYLPFDNVWCLTAMEMSDNRNTFIYLISKQVILRLIKLIRITLVLFYYIYVNEFGLSIMSQPDPFTEEFVKPI